MYFFQVKARITYSVDNTRYTQPIRLVASSTSGEWLKSSAYLEYPDPVTGVTRQYRALEEAQAGVMQISPYPTSNTVQMKRSSARRVGSTVSLNPFRASALLRSLCWKQPFVLSGLFTAGIYHAGC